MIFMTTADFMASLSVWLLSGLILQNGTCIAVSQCPCVYHGTAYPLGHVLEQGCSVWLETSNFHSFTPKTLNKTFVSPIFLTS